MDHRTQVEDRIKGPLSRAGYSKKGTCWSKQDGKASLAIWLFPGSSKDVWNYHIGAAYSFLPLGPGQKRQTPPLSNSRNLHWIIGPEEVRADLAGNREWKYFSSKSMTTQQRLDTFQDVAEKAIVLLESCRTLEGLQGFLEALNPVDFDMKYPLPELFPLAKWSSFRKTQLDTHIREVVGRDEFRKRVAEEIERSKQDPTFPPGLRGQPDQAKARVLKNIERDAHLMSYREYCEVKRIRPPLRINS